MAVKNIFILLKQHMPLRLLDMFVNEEGGDTRFQKGQFGPKYRAWG